MARGKAKQDTSTSQEERLCPLCIEPLDATEQDFYPCPCGYQVCLFCHEKLKTDCGNLCPGCRTEYKAPGSQKEILERRRNSQQVGDAATGTSTGLSKMPASLCAVKRTAVFLQHSISLMDEMVPAISAKSPRRPEVTTVTPPQPAQTQTQGRVVAPAARANSGPSDGGQPPSTAASSPERERSASGGWPSVGQGAAAPKHGPTTTGAVGPPGTSPAGVPGAATQETMARTQRKQAAGRSHPARAPPPQWQQQQQQAAHQAQDKENPGTPSALSSSSSWGSVSQQHAGAAGGKHPLMQPLQLGQQALPATAAGQQNGALLQQVERAIEKGQISVEEGTRRMVALLRQHQVHQGGAGAKRPPPPGFAAAAAAAATVPEAAAAAAVAAGVTVEDEPAGTWAGSGVGQGSGAGMGRTQLPWPASHFAVPPMASTFWTVRRLPLSGAQPGSVESLWASRLVFPSPQLVAQHVPLYARASGKQGTHPNGTLSNGFSSSVPASNVNSHELHPPH
eukprot:jgi/Astpho2/7528/fgenesh1_pg.00114_%23_108_t